MTVETRTTIELKDVEAVEFGCSKCGNRIIRQLTETPRVPMACDNCGEAWFSGTGPENGQLGDFLRRLHRYGKDDSPCILRLHIKTP